MALGTNHLTNTTQDVYIPELWSDEIVASYKSNLVMANLVTKINHNKKKGDVIHIPQAARGAASLKAAETQVTLIANTETSITVTIDQHYEYSRLIEDRTDIQALVSGKNFYANDAGYALALRVDTDIHALGAIANGGTAYSGGFIASTGATAYSMANGADIGDAGIRRTIQRLDDNDVPQTDRYLAVAPSQRNVMMGINRFTEEAYVGERGMENTIRNGRIGQVYGVEVYVSTNVATFDTTQRANLMFHSDWCVHAEQLGIRSQFQYIQEYLGTLFTADTLYGVDEIRDTSCIPLIST